MRVEWTEFKSFVSSKLAKPQFIEFDNYYYIVARDGFFELNTEVDKNPSDSTDLDDFENNYKSSWNERIGNNVFNFSFDDRLKVDTIQTNQPAGQPGSSVISCNLKMHFDDTEISLTSTHQDIFTVTGQGKLFGFAMELDSNRTAIRLEIDGKEIFDFKLKEELEVMSKFGNGKGNGDKAGVCRFFMLGKSDRVQFCPPHAIAYDTSFKIQAKETSGNRDVEWISAFYTEE